MRVRRGVSTVNCYEILIKCAAPSEREVGAGTQWVRLRVKPMAGWQAVCKRLRTSEAGGGRLD